MRASPFAIGAVIAVTFATLSARAEFHGKGSTVGRLLSESVATASAEEADLGADTENESEEKPISREALNALMKHPTIPNYDPLRPMSGRWVRCETLASQSNAKPAEVCVKPGCKQPTEKPKIVTQQERYSSADRSHFSRTLSSATDSECKNIVAQDRTLYECTTDKKTLLCKMTKHEVKTGSGPWSNVPLGGDESPITLSFPGAEKKSKKRAGKARDPRKLEARINGELVTLEYETNPPARKTND